MTTTLSPKVARHFESLRQRGILPKNQDAAHGHYWEGMVDLVSVLEGTLDDPPDRSPRHLPLDDLARVLVAHPGHGSRFDWGKLPEEAHQEVAHDALVAATQLVDFDQDEQEIRTDLLYEARWLLAYAARDWRKVHQTAPLNHQGSLNVISEDDDFEDSQQEEALEVAEEREAIRKVMAALPPDQAKALTLIAEASSFNEAVERSGWSRRIFAHHLSNARERAARALMGQ